ncbi:hypothetical protein O6H91_05G120400 [Diphasiastrum complanatum]|uniref:Uncharacterized protein n=1 Tax=Diphasiastrum complanatum TaxID=34168 RepID=A0ACC2DSU8_DIPCM|nr:hypothetical protein O6H91_Y169400 [Diphasiastrum complanatum]KAJ7557286.1 hypothetical protein O6H91_05G120400 [Diphasiastrum complanatum]
MRLFEHGGRCIRFRSKADQILSKYRPIAPKPLRPKQEEDLQSCSTVDSSKNTGLLAKGLKQNHARKRSTSSSFSSRDSKRSCTRNKFDKTRNVGQAMVLPAIKPREDFAPSRIRARSRCGTATSEVSHPDLNSQSVGSTLDLSAVSIYPNPFTAIAVGRMKAILSVESEDMASKTTPEKNTTFMEGAAEKASDPSVLSFIYSGRDVPSKSPRSSCYERIADSAASEASNTGACDGDDLCTYYLLPCLLTASSYYDIAEEKVSSKEDSSGRGKKDLVTLPLLPDEPIRSSSWAEPSLSSNSARDYEDRDADAFHLTELRLCSGNESVGGKADACSKPMAAWNERVNKIETLFLDQMYMASDNAVMLVGEAHQVLWSNAAFKKAMAERLTKKDHSLPAYIDVLGLPICLACYIIQQSPGAPNSRATLWCFLKKLVSQGGDILQQQDLSGFPVVLPAQFLDGLNASSELKYASPIAPLPVRGGRWAHHKPGMHHSILSGFRSYEHNPGIGLCRGAIGQSPL